MDMRRKVYNKLLDWKHNSRGATAVLLEGARRVGKSYIAEAFARNEYEKHLLIDFSIAPPLVHDLFKHYLDDIDTLLERLAIHYRCHLTPRQLPEEEAHTLIIFDEVQFCPKARSAIKHLVADRRYDYLETGSLISIKRNVKNILIPSEEHTIEMFPMDFEEFLMAMGNDLLFSYIRKCFETQQPMAQLHRQAIDAFRQYMIVGGMPQAVATYINTRDYNQVDTIKRDIIALYRSDIQKYGDRDGTKVAAIFDEIPSQLQRHEKKFRLSSLGTHARMRDYADAFFWLADAKIINTCFNTTEPNIGLRMSEERTTLKCYLADTGLLISLAFDEHGDNMADIYSKLTFGKLEINQGMLVENIVAQMLRAAGHKLYFFSKYNPNSAGDTMEIDFLVSKTHNTSRHNITPIEVKSGKRYTLASIKKLQTQYHSYLNTPIILHDADIKHNENTLYLPLYMTPLL